MRGSFGRDALLVDRSGVRATVTHHARAQRIEGHEHRWPCLHLILSGVYVEFDREGATVALPGDLLYKAQGSTHANLFGSSDAISLRIELDREPRWRESRASQTRLLRAPALALSTRPVPGSRDEQTQSALMRHVAEALEHLGAEPTGEPAPFSTPVPPAPEVIALQHLAHAEAPMRIAELADALGVNRYVLARRFKRRFGCSMRDYLLRRRVAAVARELSRGSRSLAQTVLEAGFADQSHGTRAFRHTLGLPPRSWMRQLRF